MKRICCLRRWFKVTILVGVTLLLVSVPPAFTEDEWKLEDYVVEHVLDNGLTVLIVERHDTPLAFCNVYYNVGSVRERTGITGISHLLEHMMFKGTKLIGVKDFEKDQLINVELHELNRKINFEKFWRRNPDEKAIAQWEKQVSELLSEEKQFIKKDEFWELTLGEGATFVNASTSNDVTGYYITIPANKIELQMVLEADRMVNSVFREFYTEKEVVREERRLAENSPGFLFMEALLAQFYGGSPYAWQVLGWDIDLQKITYDDLVTHYRRYYVPNNAVAVYGGDINPEQVIELAEKHFGSIPSGPPLEPVRTVNLPQRYEKRVHDDDAPFNRVTLLYHIPRLAHPDTAILEVLGEILGSKSGRLTKRLIEQEKIATDVWVNVDALFFDGNFEIGAELNQVPGKDMGQLEQLVTDELELFRTAALTGKEVVRAKNQLLSSFYRSLRKPWVLLWHLARYHHATGDWRNLQVHLDQLKEVTPDSIQVVAQKYFVRTNRIVGIQHRKQNETDTPYTAEDAGL